MQYLTYYVFHHQQSLPSNVLEKMVTGPRLLSMAKNSFLYRKKRKLNHKKD